MTFYPEECISRPLDRTSQAKRWLEEADPELLTPMFRDPSGRDFYTFELARLSDGRVCVPFRFFERDGRVWFKAWATLRGEGSTEPPSGWIVDESTVVVLPSDSLAISGQELNAGIFLGRQQPAISITGA
jgi:hypothetical protein